MRSINDYGYPKENLVNNRHGYAQGIINKKYNPFDPLMDQNIVCYKHNNLGHKARNCRDMKEDSPINKVKLATIWEKKYNSIKEYSRLALIAKDKKR